MTVLRNKFIATTSLISSLVLSALLPIMITLGVVLSVLSFMAASYVKQNYSIDYKYWISFVSQLLWLVLFVSCTYTMLIIGVNILE